MRGNAGAMGGEISDVVDMASVYQDGEVVELTHEEIGFAYRHSALKDDGGIVLSVSLVLKRGESLEGRRVMIEHLKYRSSTQPQGWASTGCIFKNVECRVENVQGQRNRKLLLNHVDEANEKVQQFFKVGKISAGWLVEQAGTKGARVGQAQVSERHGNFIVNLGAATAGDVLFLIEKCKHEVYTSFGIELEEEIQII